MQPAHLWQRALQRRELEQRERALETLLNQEAVTRVVRPRPVPQRRNAAALNWLRRELLRVRDELL